MGILIQAQTYTATFDKKGNLISLQVGGVEIFDSESGKFPLEGGVAILHIETNKLVAREKNVSVSYIFSLTNFHVQTSGGTVSFNVKGVSTVVTDTGSFDGKKPILRITKLICGSAVAGLSQPFHLLYGKLVPSVLYEGKAKPEDPFSY